MKKWQRSLLAVLSFCLCLLPMTVSATEEDGESISVGNVTLTPETEYAKTDMGTVTTEGANQEDYNIRWEASSATLTLNGAEISAEDILCHPGRHRKADHFTDWRKSYFRKEYPREC